MDTTLIVCLQVAARRAPVFVKSKIRRLRIGQGDTAQAKTVLAIHA